MAKKGKKQTGAERQRAYMERLKADPERYERMKEKDRKRWHERQKSVKTDRAKRHQRQKWRESTARCRARKRAEREQFERLEQMTPEASPAREEEPLDIAEHQPVPHQLISARKRVKRGRNKLHQKVVRLERKLEEANRRAEMYRKRLQRSQGKGNVGNKSCTPIKIAKSILGKAKNKSKIMKNLAFSTAVTLSVKRRYQESKSNKEKQYIRKLLQGHMKKYKMQRMASLVIGLPNRRKNGMTDGKGVVYQRKLHNSLGRRLSEVVKAFLKRDDNSRITTGKKDTITRHGIKMQRRILTETMKRLHSKYLEEDNPKIGFSLFCRLRPFYIVSPTNKDRDTCLCRMHENGKLLLDRLIQLKLIPQNITSVEDAVASATCDKANRDCFERKCQNCITKLQDIYTENEDEISWQQWKTVKEDRMIRGKLTTIQRTVKERLWGTASELHKAFLSMLPKLCWHIMVLKHQFKQYKALKDDGNYCVVVVDFSENYTLQENRAIQSAHFGASNSQVTLHTGVLYLQNTVTSFCTVSDNTRHDAAAVWAHLQPVLDLIKSKLQGTPSVHFWSDGPTSQYRNKTAFFFFSCIQSSGFGPCTWNFFESNHGKGPADAIGGIVKRTADTAINTGCQIKDAEGLCRELSKRTKVKLFVISTEDIERMQQKLVGVRPKVIPGTMKLHQLQNLEQSSLSVRILSCFCKAPAACGCHSAQRYVTCEEVANNDGPGETRNEEGRVSPVREAGDVVTDADLESCSNRSVRNNIIKEIKGASRSVNIS